MADKKDRSPEELAKLEEMDRKMVYVSAKNERDFWSQVDTSAEGDEGHWIWLGGFNNQGHPTMTLDGETFGPHRLSWVLHTGEAHPSYNRIRRKCGDKRCVRPEHLKVSPRNYKKHLGDRPRHRFTVLTLEGEATSRKPRLAAADMGPTPGQQRFDQLIDRMDALQRTVTLSNRTVTNHLSQHREALQKSINYGPQTIEKIERKIDELTSLMEEALERLSRVEEETEATGSAPQLRLVDAEPEPESEPTAPTKDPDPEDAEPDEPDESDEKLDAALTQAFGQGPLSEEGLKSLRQVFQLAIAEADKDSVEAGSTFYDWVSQYRDIAIEGGSGPTPEGLYRAVTSGKVA